MLTFIQNNSEFFIFIILLSVFLYVKRKNLAIQGPAPFLYMLMYKTSLGLDKMDRWSKNHPKIFLYLAYLSIFIGILGMISMFILMFWQLGFIVENDLQQGGGFVLPLKTEKGMDSAVPVFYVPFWYWLIALLVLVIVHEFAHGVIAERFNIKIKSSGFAFGAIGLPILPAAFVEPDEKDLKKKPRWQQIAVFGAGSTSNFIFGFLFLGLWIFAAGPLIDNTMTFDKLEFSSVMNQSDLKQYNLSEGEILSINGITGAENIYDYLRNLTPNQTINLEILSNEKIDSYIITSFANSNDKNKGMIGITLKQIQFTNQEGKEWVGNFPLYFERLLFYIWFLNIAIGMFNLLPIWITDGGQICYAMLSKYFKEKKAISLYNWISFLSLLTIIFTLAPSLLIDLIKFIS